MFRLFRKGRASPESGNSRSPATPTPRRTPEKSPQTTTPTPKRGLRRGRRSTTAAATPTTATPSPSKSTPAARNGSPRRSLVTPETQSQNLLHDMQAQLEAPLPRVALLQPKNSRMPRSTSDKSSSSSRSTRFGRATSGRKDKTSKKGPAVDSGCHPQSRASEAAAVSAQKTDTTGSPKNLNKRAPPEGPAPRHLTEEEAAEWNRVTAQAAAWDKQGAVHFEAGQYDQAFLAYEKALQLKRQTLPAKAEQPSTDQDKDSEASLLASVATSINNMTYLRQRSGRASSDETMAAYLQSLQMKREILGPHHLSVGKTLNNIGSVFYLQRDYEPALKAYQNAHKIMEDQLGVDHLDVGTVLSNIGDVHFAMGDKQPAKDYYRKALDVRWGALGPADPKVIRLMEQLAYLETGKQPQRGDTDDLSDSEGEEFIDEADRVRNQRFAEEVKVLQEELAADMKFFDLLERKMAIDMVRDKTRMFRRMRQIETMTEDEEFMDISESTADYSETDILMTSSSIATTMGTGVSSLLGANRVLTPEDLTDVAEPNESPHISASTSFLDRGNSSLMTSQERQEALSKVRSRLANLRASRATDAAYESAATSWAAQPESLQAI